MTNTIESRPIRTLIIDDNQLVITQLQSVLGRAGFQVIAAVTTGEAGLRQIAKKEPDVVCLDIGLPGMDGMSVLRDIKAQYPHIHVVMFSTDSRRSTLVDALSAGAIGYVVKPFSAAQVLAVLDPIAALHLGKPPEDATGESVVVVEQNSEMRALLVHMLRTLKFKVVAEAETGMEGLIHLERFRPAMICMTIDSPEVKGLDAITAVKALHPEVAVVFVTAHAERELVQTAVDRGANAYVLKPITLAKVQAGMSQALQSARAARHSAGAQVKQAE